MFDVITIGSATVDIFAYTKADVIKLTKRKVTTKDICYPVGDKILVKHMEIMTGGGGTNTAVSFSRLGLKTAYLGNIGNDRSAKRILDELRKEKVSFIGTISNDKTNISIVLDSIAKDRTILVYKDASEKFSFAKIKKSMLKAKWFYLCAMVDKEYRELEKIAAFAKKNKIKIAFNPSSYLAQKGFSYLKKVISKTNLLVLNKEEAALVLKKKTANINALLKGLKKLGPEFIVITDGKKGAYCYDGRTKYTIVPQKIKVVETTGAGDSFASAFLAGMIRKNNIGFALKLALMNSQSVISNVGAKNILLKWSEAIKKVKKSPRIKMERIG